MTPEELRMGLRTSVLDDTTADEIVLAVVLASKVVDAWVIGPIATAKARELRRTWPELGEVLDALARGPK